MAGHRPWAKNKRAKGANDAKRGKVWSKIARKITIAAKNGGDPRDNLALRYVMEEAKAANMFKDTIANAIKKGTGELGGENYEAINYEGYGPGGVAIMVEALTNNRALKSQGVGDKAVTMFLDDDLELLHMLASISVATKYTTKRNSPAYSWTTIVSACHLPCHFAAARV